MSDQIILGELEAGGPLPCDLATLVDSRALVTGNSGAGKSRLLRRICEQAFGKVQIIVIDPEGEFPTLREKHAFLLAGRGGEVPAEPRAAALLARRLMELRASAVLDLYDLKLPERRGFVRAFLESLMELPRDQYRPVLIVIDEAQLFCPEKGYGEAESSESVIALMTQGRKRGLCGVPATLRLSAFDKTAAAQATNVFVGRTVLDVDQKRAAAVLGITTGPERVALRDLPQGVFLAYGPALLAPGVVRFQGGEVATTHPKAGQRHSAVAPPAPDAVRKVAAELKDLPEQAAEEIRTLQAAKARVRDLERELREAKRAAPAAAAPKAPRVVEKLILKDRAASRLEHAVVTLNAAAHRLDEAAQKAQATAASVAVQVGEIKAAIAAATATRPVGTAAGQPGSAHRAPVDVGASRPVAASRPAPVVAREATGGLSGPEQRILDALAWLESIGQRDSDQAAVAFLAGYTVGGGAFNNPRGALNTKGLVAYRNGRLALTDAGRNMARFPDQALTPDELQRRVLKRLPGPESRILAVLLKAYPESVGNDDLARAAGYEPGGGAFNNPRGRLRTLGLIDYPERGQVKAQPVLFLEGAA